MKLPAASCQVSPQGKTVTPPQAGVQKRYHHLDSRLRGNDTTAASCGELDSQIIKGIFLPLSCAAGR
jgi:hypothetical protein